MAPPSLVVLAAGMGRRFGALKQVTPVGPGGAALVDHTIADAVGAGVERVVVVVRPEIRDEVVGHLVARAPVPLAVVEQPGPGPGRSVPWGAAEAVALALAAGPGPAVVANADDHYGADAVAAVVGWLRSAAAGPGRAALATWPLAATTSPRGPVTRATCVLGPDGSTVERLAERHDVELLADGTARAADGPIDPRTPVSMNLWALPDGLAGPLAEVVAAFRAGHAGDPGAELPLPTALDELVRGGRLAVSALPVGTRWVGVTHPDDLEPARDALRDLDPLPLR